MEWNTASAYDRDFSVPASALGLLIAQKPFQLLHQPLTYGCPGQKGVLHLRFKIAVHETGISSHTQQESFQILLDPKRRGLSEK